MNMTYDDLKKLVFVAQTVFGALLIWLASSTMPGDQVLNYLVRTVLFLSGAGLLFFGLVTYLLIKRQDPDVWR